MSDKDEQEKVTQAVLKAIPKNVKPRNVVLALYPILTKFSREFIRKVEKDEF